MQVKKSFFDRLERMFSTDIIVHNIGGRSLKALDVNKIQQTGKLQTNALMDRFNRIYSNSNTSLYSRQANYNFLALRPQLYSEYDAMDTDAIVASALDIIADESTLKDDLGDVLTIKSSNEDIQQILHNLFYDVLNIEFNLWMWIRNMCKYGDFFLKLEIAEKLGVYNVIPYSANQIERVESPVPDPDIKIKYKFHPDGLAAHSYGYNRVPGNDNSMKNAVVFDNYEVAHFRLLTEMNFLPYGRSYLEPARKLFKQYTLMEDAMLIHRIVRAPEKRVHYINIGSLPPNEVDGFMEKVISKLKRSPQTNEDGEYDLRANMTNILEDYFLPMRNGDQTTKIDTLPGLQWEGINDVEYLRDKLFAALKVPKAFMGYAEDLEGKSTLASQDIRFARTIERIQRIITSELYKIALVHLYAQGFRDEDLGNFELSLTTPSVVYEQEKINLLTEKVGLAQSILDAGILPTDWIYEHILGLSSDQYNEYRDLMNEDAVRRFRRQQLEDEGNDPLKSGKSYGTPHDLASLYGKERMYKDPSNVPDKYKKDNDKTVLGRPKEKLTTRNTQDDNFGKDRLGNKGAKDIKPEPNPLKTKFKGNSPLALEGQVYLKKLEKDLNMFPDKKQLVFEYNKKSNKKSLLDESQIKE